MNGKTRRHKRASPKSAGHCAQNQKERDHCRDVEEDAGEMMSARI